MRKHDVRKWLHAVLDLLPVILIPVFMIYSHRHTIDSGSIQVSQNEIVDFNQQVNFNESNFWEKVESYDINIIAYSYNNYLVACEDVVIPSGHKFIYRASITENNYYRTANVGDIPYLDYTDLYAGYESIIISTGANSGITLVNQNTDIDNYETCSFKANIIDLTQMFGVGNEPTLQQFNQWYSEPYYDFTLSHKELLKGTSTITYADTDIMSQVVYQLYNSVDKYFNMGNVFNMTGVYDWFNLNIFNGNAPISIYIVWNIVLYEFVMDLLFLLYGLFMWFIDMVEKLMEKPLKSVK